MARLGNLFTETADGLTDDYREYVYKHYLDYPTKGTETMQQFVQEHPGANLEEICNTVRTMLDENAVYNPQVGRFPQEQNFAEYFLFEQKEGYCVHFATAAVLLMRMYGVPARYVTGFAVPSSDFEWQDQAGWTANVVDGRAHAWQRSMSIIMAGFHLKPHHLMTPEQNLPMVKKIYSRKHRKKAKYSPMCRKPCRMKQQAVTKRHRYAEKRGYRGWRAGD